MSKNLVVLLLCVVFLALAIVYKSEGGIEEIAYAQIWDFTPNIQSHNNVQVNSNLLQHNNNKVSITANCISRVSNIHNNNTTVISSLNNAGVNMSPSKTSANCDTNHYDRSTKHFHSCLKLAISHDGIVRHANTIKHRDVIKSISRPLINNTNNIPVQEICGTNHDDYILGTEGDDIIFGLRGNDIIMALGGNDLVYAGPGGNRVYGGEGNNQLFGEDANDNLIGGTADDLLVGGSGDDRFYGNAGDDILQGDLGADYFDCGDGVDTVVDYSPTQGDVISDNCENVNLIQ